MVSTPHLQPSPVFFFFFVIDLLGATCIVAGVGIQAMCLNMTVNMESGT
jgi:hypothetical protein